MYYAPTDTPARVRTMNLNEDLGQVRLAKTSPRDTRGFPQTSSTARRERGGGGGCVLIASDAPLFVLRGSSLRLGPRPSGPPASNLSSPVGRKVWPGEIFPGAQSIVILHREILCSTCYCFFSRSYLVVRSRVLGGNER